MSLLPEVETVLMDAIRRDQRARARGGLVAAVRRRLRGQPRALIVVLAALAIAGPAFAAVELLQRGSTVGPSVPPTPTAIDGAAITGSIRLLPLRVADPAGGPPWGARIERTTRGVVCVQVGRVAFGTVGALGRDGAFGDDGRFHPFSPNYDPGPVPCPVPDADGHAFLNVSVSAAPNSGLLFGGVPGGCVSPAAGPDRSRSVCPRSDVREVQYGLLGPDAVSVTYQSASGGTATMPTVGSDGAYLIVLPYRAAGGHAGSGQVSSDSALFPGAIRAVHYRDGHTCQLPAPGPYSGGIASCPPVGYVSRARRLPTSAQVAAPVSARIERSNTKAWCVHLDPPGIPAPCRGHTPPGDQRMTGGPPSALVLVSWISRVPVRNSHSYYYWSFTPPRGSSNPNVQSAECGGTGQESDQTDSNYKAGQRVTQSFFEPLACHGVAHGNVSLVISTGPSVAGGALPAVPGHSVGREVGTFSFKLP